MSVITDEQFDELMKSLSFRNSQNLLYPYIQTDIYGRNNQIIEIRQEDGKLMQALFLLDSNDYVSGGKINSMMTRSTGMKSRLRNSVKKKVIQFHLCYFSIFRCRNIKKPTSYMKVEVQM